MFYCIIIIVLLWVLYRIQTPKPAKLKLLRGSTVSITAGGECLKLYCCVGIVPGLSLARGRKVPLDRVCGTVQVHCVEQYGKP